MTAHANSEADRYWKQCAHVWKKLHQAGITSLFLNARRTVLLDILRDTPRSFVIDIGCGTAGLLEFEGVGTAAFVGLDYSLPMLKIAAERRVPRAHFVQADARFLPIKSNLGPQLLTMIGLLDYVDEPGGAVREAARLKPRWLVLTAPARPSPFWLLRTRAFGFIRRYLLGLPPIRTALTQPQFQQLVRAEGFEIVRMRKVYQTMWMALARPRQCLTPFALQR